MNSPLLNEARKNLRITNSKISSNITTYRNNSSTQTNKNLKKSHILSGKRPFSWLEMGTKDSFTKQLLSSNNVQKYDNEFNVAISSQNSTPNSSPLLE